MRHLLIPWVLILMTLPCQAMAATKPDPLCAPLRAFASSVQPDQTKSLEFHTSWGGGFKGSDKRTMYEVQCIDHGYAPAKAVCKQLMEQGAVEFSGENAKRALVCLSQGTQFGQNHLQLGQAEFSFYFGTEQRGSNITMQFQQDPKMGGMVLSITAEGY